MTSISIKGDKELRAALLELPTRTRVRVLTKANREVMKKALKIAKANVPQDSGLLRKSLGVQVYKDGRKGQISATIGPRKGWDREVEQKIKLADGSEKTIKRRRDPRKYAHFVEFGTTKTEAKPFLRPALQAIEPEIESGYAKIVFDGIQIEFEKEASRGG